VAGTSGLSMDAASAAGCGLPAGLAVAPGRVRRTRCLTEVLHRAVCRDD